MGIHFTEKTLLYKLDHNNNFLFIVKLMSICVLCSMGKMYTMGNSEECSLLHMSIKGGTFCLIFERVPLDSIKLAIKGIRGTGR